MITIANQTENTNSTPTPLSDATSLTTAKENIENFLTGKTKTFDYAEFARVVKNELKFNNAFTEHTCMGFSKKEIIEMAQNPERHGKRILKLSDYMYRKSGYYKRLIDYFANQAILRYTIDTKLYTDKLSAENKTTLKNNYIKFLAFADRLNLSNEIHNITKAMFKNDVVYAYVDTNGMNNTYYYLDPMICEISSLIDGNVYGFYIQKNKISKSKFITLPPALQELLNKSNPPDSRVIVPYENSLCLKYNNDFVTPYPPFLMMITDIMLIDEYKDLTKAQSINDAYKLLTMKIPTKDGEITLDDGLITTFTSVVLDTVQNSIGVITTPFDTATEEFSSSNADDRDTVSDAISWAFKNVGVSEALMSGASSGSELKYSIINDSGDIFRIYRMIENWVILQANLHKFVYNDYRFVYKIIDMTIFNQQDIADKELSLAQNGIPNKTRLCAVNNISPIEMLGNSLIENELFADTFSNWSVLQTSYTQSSGSSDKGGRPKMDETDLSKSGEVTANNDTNDKANRDF